jgi:hypothetical protein
MSRTRTSQSPRAPSPARPADYPGGLAARIRANLPGPASYALFAATVIAARWWLHVAVPLAVAVVTGSAIIVIAVSVAGDMITSRRHGDGHERDGNAGGGGG